MRYILRSSLELKHLHFKICCFIHCGVANAVYILYIVFGLFQKTAKPSWFSSIYSVAVIVCFYILFWVCVSGYLPMMSSDVFIKYTTTTTTTTTTEYIFLSNSFKRQNLIRKFASLSVGSLRFLSKNIWRGSIATHLTGGGVFNYCFSRNLLLSVTVKIFQTLSAFGKVITKNKVASFSEHGVHYLSERSLWWLDVETRLREIWQVDRFM